MYKLLSHNDLDGVGCGILAKLAFGKDVKVRYNSISSLDRSVEWFLEHDNKDTFLLITDLSVNEENEKRLNMFYEDGGKVQLIDHHKTALHLNAYDWAHVAVENDAGKLNSATSLLYEYLVTEQLLTPSDTVTQFVELVRQYDTWEWEQNDNQEARRLNALFFLVSVEEFEEKMLERLQTDNHFTFDAFEMKILDMEDKKIERYIRRKKRQITQHSILTIYLAGIVYAESYHSELGNQIVKEWPHLDFIAIVNMGAKRLGFRTIHDHIDVSEIASHFGGGGHAKASGSTLTTEAYEVFVHETFHLLPLRQDAHRNRYNLKHSSFGSLYENHAEDIFLIFPVNEHEWGIEQNHTMMEQSFSSFEEAETYLKRKFTAWLVRDDVFVNYLLDQVKEKTNRKK